jgi:hypothetical protein
MVLELEEPNKFIKPHASNVMHTAAVEAIARGTIPLLSLMDLADRISASDDYFKPLFTHAAGSLAGSVPFFSCAFGRLAKTFLVASSFLFFKTSVKTGTG